MKGDDRTFQTTENIFPLFTYLLVITNPLHLRAFQSHGYFAFIKTVFSAAISFFILHEWMPFCCFPHSYEQSLKHRGSRKKKKKPLKSPLLVFLYIFCCPLNCTATVLLRAELEWRSQRGSLTTHSCSPSPQGDLHQPLVSSWGKGRGGVPLSLPLGSASFIYCRFNATGWLISVVHSWLRILITLDFRFPILRQTLRLCWAFWALLWMVWE